MRPVITLLILFLAIAGSVAIAAAERKSLFLFKNFNQVVHFTYNFNNYDFSDYSSTRHRAYEDYVVGTDYAVLDPRLVNGRFSLGFRFKQDRSNSQGDSSTSTGLGVFYDIRGVFGDRGAYPLHFFLNSKIEDFSGKYGIDYQVTTDNYGFSLILRNRYLPSTINYMHSVSEIDGMEIDNKIIRDELSLHVKNSYRISQTYLSLTFLDENYRSYVADDDDFTDSAILDFGNTLDWETLGKFRRLNSFLKVWKATGLNERDDLEWSESLAWELGQALHSGAIFSFSRARGERFDRTATAERGWLQHELFKSLITRLELFARDTDFSPGAEEVVGGRIGWAYRKVLPATGSLNIQLYKQYQVTDRDLENMRQTYPNEAHTVNFAERLLLNNLNVLPESIAVRNADPLLHIGDYQRDVDYTVVQLGALTQIVVTGAGLSNVIEEGMVLLITYDVQVDPNLEFSSDSEGIAGEIRMRGNRYRIFGSYDQVRQDITGGDENALHLTDQNTLRMGFEREWETITLLGEYQRLESDRDVHSSLGGSLRYYTILPDGSLSLYLRDRYWWYDVDNGAAIDDQNSLTLGGQYRTLLFDSVQTTATADYQRVMGGSDSDRIALGADFRWAFRKLTLSLRSQAGFRRLDGKSTSDQHVRLEITRFF
ncbi:MAG: hypothetical protein WDA20_06150 [Desulfuromonadales bacterium]